jgi:NADH dehydrogenase
MSDLLILGGGFAGLWAALVARREAEEQGSNPTITLVSKDDKLTLRPRLYETGPDRFQVPLRPVLAPVDITFVEGEAISIDTQRRRVVLAGGDEIFFQRLVLATGSVLAPPPVPGAEEAFDLDTWEAAMRFDRHLRDTMPALNAPVIAILGAGFTGIEIAMEARARIEAASDHATATAARVLLLDRADEVAQELGDNPRPVIEAALRQAGVELKLGVSVAAIDNAGLVLENGERIDADAVVVCSGMVANPLTGQIAAARDEVGRLIVNRDLSVAGVDGVFATGDVAHAVVDDDGHVAMMSCQHAMMMGRFAGYNAVRELLQLPTTPYRQERYVTCLDLGSAGAVFTRGWDREVELTGADAKKVKKTVNGEIIYPPQGTRADILAAATLVPGHHRAPPEQR